MLLHTTRTLVLIAWQFAINNIWRNQTFKSFITPSPFLLLVIGLVRNQFQSLRLKLVELLDKVGSLCLVRFHAGVFFFSNFSWVFPRFR